MTAGSALTAGQTSATATLEERDAGERGQPGHQLVMEGRVAGFRGGTGRGAAEPVGGAGDEYARHGIAGEVSLAARIPRHAGVPWRRPAPTPAGRQPLPAGCATQEGHQPPAGALAT